MITHHCVGYYPKDDNGAYWVVSHPAGTKRWCWSVAYRDEMIRVFEKCDSYTDDVDFNVVSERTAFELALLGMEQNGNECCGWPLDENGKGGYYL